MKEQDLRIGNWVKWNGDYYQVTSITRQGQLRVQSYGNHPNETTGITKISPIPLTPEWLEKLGFELCNTGLLRSYQKDVTGITMAQSELLSLSMNSDKQGYWYVAFRQGKETELELLHLNELVFLKRDLKYVHQLQNLYYSLTGTELKAEI